MEMTIKQLANQLGVSKTTISKAIFALGLQGELKRSGNKYLLSEVQIESVKTQIANQKSQTAGQKSQTENQNALIEVLQKQLTLLNGQLNIKDDQIRTHQEQIRLLQEQIVSKDKQIEQITVAMENITAALTASQALHAGTIQQQLTEQNSSRENTAPDDPEQPKQKQGFFSKFFGKKNN
jgi:DNA-binding GntR family transcriptional regulator